MSSAPSQDRTPKDFEPRYGTAVRVAPRVRRITADNPGPFTFTGTNTYLIGDGRVAVVDPGPADDRHVAALLAALGGEEVSHILLTHAHRDHSGAVAELARRTGAPVFAARPAPVEDAAKLPRLDAASEEGLAADVVLADGTVVAGDGWALETVATPGHASDHVAFALAGTDILLCGDHVMGWATSVVAPPDGVMADYMSSLERLLSRAERHYLPGHGGPITDGSARTRALRTHRRMREAAIIERLRAGDRVVPTIVAALYADVDPRLHVAAGLSVLAHLQDLVARRLVRADGPVSLEGSYRPA